MRESLFISSKTHGLKATDPKTKGRAGGRESPEYTYGPGVARRHPWTSRRDEGINSRSADGHSRGNEIYFMGIIDILQQYNIGKRAETAAKVS